MVKDHNKHGQRFANYLEYTALVPHLYSPTPLYHPPMCVLPHRHMLLRIVLLWRTQSTSYPQLSLVTVSGLCGRTGLDRMDCCVIDFNLESAPPSPTLFVAGILLAPSRSLPPGSIPDYTAEKTHLSKVAGVRWGL